MRTYRGIYADHQDGITFEAADDQAAINHAKTVAPWLPGGILVKRLEPDGSWLAVIGFNGWTVFAIQPEPALCD